MGWGCPSGGVREERWTQAAGMPPSRVGTGTWEEGQSPPTTQGCGSLRVPSSCLCLPRCAAAAGTAPVPGEVHLQEGEEGLQHYFLCKG